MRKLEAKPLWKCGHCEEIHDDEDDAQDCCRPEVRELWGCPECEKVHGEESLAVSCCAELTRCPSCHREYGQGHINHHAITLSGHCNTCSPFFTPDQQIAIEDMHWQYTGISVRLNA
jgi:hypothetical protein